MLSDWKWSTVGSPTFDLATLMLSATPSKEFRDAYVKPLLQTYHRVFTGALSSRYGLEYPSFTCEDLVKDYEMSLHGAFLKVSQKIVFKEKESPKNWPTLNSGGLFVQFFRNGCHSRKVRDLFVKPRPDEGQRRQAYIDNKPECISMSLQVSILSVNVYAFL